jgi:pyruvate/2-oxoglutarate dehydrogenase complex dihydrolipoamide dehydrogenase (E3) component
LEEVIVYEKTADSFRLNNPHIEIVHERVDCIDYSSNEVILSDGKTNIPYKSLCIAVGVRPKAVVAHHPRITGLRDSESVKQLLDKLSSARRIAIIGNGGIALELIHEVHIGITEGFGYCNHISLVEIR